MQRTGLAVLAVFLVLTTSACAPLLIGGAAVAVADEAVEQDQGRRRAVLIGEWAGLPTLRSGKPGQSGWLRWMIPVAAARPSDVMM
jgi:hypothetical protein